MRQFNLYKGTSIYKGNGIYIDQDVLPSVDDMSMRFRFSDNNYNPELDGVGTDGTWNRLSTNENIWDWSKENSNWKESFKDAFQNQLNLVEVLETGNLSILTDVTSIFKNCSSLISFKGNLAAVKIMASMFYGCNRLENISLFSTGASTNMSSMFYGCSSLKSMPKLDTNKVVYIGYAFYNCKKIESGIYAMYSQLISQTTPPSSHTDTFHNCGIDTVSGSSELSMIPSDWGGTAT